MQKFDVLISSACNYINSKDTKNYFARAPVLFSHKFRCNFEPKTMKGLDNVESLSAGASG